MNYNIISFIFFLIINLIIILKDFSTKLFLVTKMITNHLEKFTVIVDGFF